MSWPTISSSRSWFGACRAQFEDRRTRSNIGWLFVASGQCVLRYDNEAGNGDHRHVGVAELPYAFVSYEKLVSDFWADVENWRQWRK